MFNVTIEQCALMKALEYLEPTVGKNSTGVGDNCLSMESTTAGSILMYTTNTIEFTEVEVIATTNTNGTFLAPYVDFKRFKGIIATVPPSEYITLEQSVNDLLITFSLRSKPIRLVGCTNGMLPMPSFNAPTEMVTLTKNFVKNTIDKASLIITDSQMASLYNCVKFSTDDINVTAEAIDINSKRTYVSKFTGGAHKNPKKDILIEAPKFKKSLKIFEDYNEIEMLMDSNIIMLSGGDPVSQYRKKSKGNISEVNYYVRQLSGAFPNVSSYFTNMPNDFITISREDLLNSISRVKAIGDEASFKTGVAISANKSNFEVRFSSSYGDIVDPVDVSTGTNTPFNAIFKHDTLEDLIKALSDSSYLDIALMPKTQGNFIIRNGSGSGSSTTNSTTNDMFSLSSMAGAIAP